MEALLLAIYAFFVWLIFIKFKWLPWNIRSQVVVVLIPVVGMTVLILLLNVFAPSSADVRVIKYVVQVVPQVRGRLVEVPVTGNQYVKKGDVLFRIDATPYELRVKTLEAQLAAAGASESQVRERLLAQVAGDLAEVAQIKAELENARWELSQTTTYAPANGWIINLQLRPGSFALPLPAMVAMTFVEDEYQVVALYNQNELHQVEPGNRAELTLRTLPGKIIKAKVNSIIWAQGQGQVPISGTLPQTGLQPLPPGRFAVKLDVDEKYRDSFFAAGASGEAAIYTNRLAVLHVIRMVILRVGAKLNYIIPKLH